jgi:hypothetical protein
MVTADRSGKSVALGLLDIRDVPREDYDSAYVLWKMGAPIGPLAIQLMVDEFSLKGVFEVQRWVEVEQSPRE